MSQPIAGYQARFSTNYVTGNTDASTQVWYSNPTVVDVIQGSSIVHNRNDYAWERNEKRKGTSIEIPGRTVILVAREASKLISAKFNMESRR